jgi:hypothetical protein
MSSWTNKVKITPLPSFERGACASATPICSSITGAASSGNSRYSTPPTFQIVKESLDVPGNLFTRIHDAGIEPSIMSRFMQLKTTHEVLFVN